MPNLIEKKDRRFPIGAIALAFCVALSVISSVFHSLANLWNTEQFFGFVIKIGDGISVSFFDSVTLIAIIVMLFAKVHHITYIIPGIIALCSSITALFEAFEQAILYLLECILGTFYGFYTLNDLINLWLEIGFAFVCVIGWICYILLVIFATNRKKKASVLTMLLTFGACLIFIGGLLSCSCSFVYELINLIYEWIMFGFNSIFNISDTPRFIFRTIALCITAGANIIGAIAILMIGLWFKNPAKGGYVPTATAQTPAEGEDAGTEQA